jgi:hypothetical protein
VGLGVVCKFQELPFQRSANVSSVPELLKYSPTAVQAEVDTHDTPPKKLSRAPAGLGVACNCQELPLQRSTRVTAGLELLPE